jgi:ABC-type glycerol-3-phosphate transport system substrate-binding protein
VSKARLLVAAFLLVLVSGLALTACGGGGESDEDKIAGAIETAATSEDPASCEETQTQAFMEQNSGGEGQESVKKCEEDAEEGTGNADSVEVSKIEVEGSEASAVAAVTGGGLDGQSIAINLVEKEGDWKLDEFEAFVAFNREKLISAFEGLLGESEEVEPELGECVVEGLEELSESELEETVLAGEEGIGSIAEECVE